MRSLDIKLRSHIKKPLILLISISLLLFTLIATIDSIFTIIITPEIASSGSLYTELGEDLVLFIRPNSSVILNFNVSISENSIIVIPYLYDIYGVSYDGAPEGELILMMIKSVNNSSHYMLCERTQWLSKSNSYRLIIPKSEINGIKFIFRNPTNNTTYVVKFYGKPHIIIKNSIFNFIYAIDYEAHISLFFLGFNILQEFYIFALIISIIISLIATLIYRKFILKQANLLSN